MRKKQILKYYFQHEGSYSKINVSDANALIEKYFESRDGDPAAAEDGTTAAIVVEAASDGAQAAAEEGTTTTLW